MPVPTPPPTPLLTHLDWTAVAWAAFWALMFSLPRIGQLRRQQRRARTALMPWWWAIVESLTGGIFGGLLLALVVPEYYPDWRMPGKQALLAVVGAIVAPWLAGWIKQIIVQLVAFFSERKIGIRIELKDEAPASRRKRARPPELEKEGDTDES